MNCYLIEKKKALNYETISISVPCHVENKFLISVNVGYLVDFVCFLFLV